MFATRARAYVIVVLAVLTSAAAADAASAFIYQGQLKRDGVPVSETCALTFRLFDAASAGAQIGSDVVIADVQVANGLFTADADFGAAAFGGAARWLEISAACTGDITPITLSPRQPITPAPLAINADTLDGLHSSSFLQGVPVPLVLSGSAISTPILRGTNTSATAGATGVLGESTGTSNSTFGVWGISNSSTGIGVFGQHKSLSGSTAGVVGESLSGAAAATGVYGKAAGTSAVNNGVFGETLSTGGRGVYGKATAATGVNYGVYGETASPSGVGVHGFSDLGDGVTGRTDGDGKAGVTGTGTHANSKGVLGKHTSLAGVQAGVHGETASGTGGARGVYGLATFGTGGTFGVYGEAASTSGQGVFGIATATTGTTYGVQGESASGTAGAAGVVGYARGTTGQVYGVFGKCDSNTGYAVYGNHPGSGRGVSGASASGPGVYATTGTGSYAVYAERTQNSNRAWLGGTSEGAWAESVNGNGLVAKTTNGVNAVFAERIGNGNKGSFGGLTEGARGEAAQGHGVAGITTDAAGAGGYFRNDGGGTALIADGHAIVTTLDIIDGGDLAERFDVGGNIEPGMVVVIDPDRPGALTRSSKTYDRKVAGIVSGANGLKAGIALAPGNSALVGGASVALSGKVWCWCDASNGPIEPGDMLTTSSAPGHAMKATDLTAAQGAIIGKAMTALPEGRGLVLVLVNLQ